MVLHSPPGSRPAPPHHPPPCMPVLSAAHSCFACKMNCAWYRYKQCGDVVCTRHESSLTHRRQTGGEQGELHMGCAQSHLSERREWDQNIGRWVVRRVWRNACGKLHRTTGPAEEDWTVLPGGGRVLSYQGWYVNGKAHREGRPAYRWWHVANDGTRALVSEGWWRAGMEHRVGGPAYRRWTAEPDGTRTLVCKWWWANGKLHRVDGPALHRVDGPALHRVDGPALHRRGFFWHSREAPQEHLPWLRRGQGVVVPFVATARVQKRPACRRYGGGVFPVWCRDVRLARSGAAPTTLPVPFLYCSLVGGAVLLCV